MKAIFLFVALLFAATPASAGIYTDDLSRCLVEKTTKDDRISLVRWMFSAAAAHPAVAPIAKVSATQLDAANKAVGELFMKLMTETCREQTKKALKYEGPTTIPAAFQVFGQVAAADLFSSPEVTKAMSGLEKYADGKKLEALTQEE
jgi:hypothetical protein